MNKKYLESSKKVFGSTVKPRIGPKSVVEIGFWVGRGGTPTHKGMHAFCVLILIGYLFLVDPGLRGCDVVWLDLWIPKELPSSIGSRSPSRILFFSF